MNIELVDSIPPIYRHFMVPSNITLDRLHDVIQIVMGWTDSHLHEFDINNTTYIEFMDQEIEGLNSAEFRLNELVSKKGDSFIYLYDYGDSWDHNITIIDNNYNNLDSDTDLFCIMGERACPPLGVGGIYHYSKFLESLHDPTDEEYEENLMWVGEDFDSEEFHCDDVNIELLTYLRWSRDREQKW